jgi:hypothetical protein
MKESNGKGPSGGHLSARNGERIAARAAPVRSAPVVADSSAGTWKKYCESRLRHFALGR